MDIQTAVFAVLSPTTLGSTITVTGIPFQPKALIFWWSGRTGTVDASGLQTHRRGFGFAESTTQRGAVSTQSEFDSAGANCDLGMRQDCVMFDITTAGAIDGIADLDSINSDGFTLIADDAFADQPLIHHWLIGGADISNVDFGLFNEPATATTQDIATGFDMSSGNCGVFFMAEPTGVALPSISVDSRCMFGFAGGVDLGNVVWAGGSDNAANPTNTLSYCRKGQCLANVSNPVASINTRAQVSAWLATGFRLSYSEVTSTARNYFYLAIKGGKWKCDGLTSKTNTTAFTTGGFFEPRGTMFLSAGSPEDADDTPHDTDQWSLGASENGTSNFDNNYSMNATDRDNVATADVSTILERDGNGGCYVHIDPTTGAMDGRMYVTTHRADGFSAVMEDADAAENFVGFISVGVEVWPTVADDLPVRALYANVRR